MAECQTCDEALNEINGFLSPDNENVRRRDLRACIRDLAQIAMLALEETAHNETADKEMPTTARLIIERHGGKFKIYANDARARFEVEAISMAEVFETIEHYNAVGSYMLRNKPRHSNAERVATCPLCRFVYESRLKA